MCDEEKSPIVATQKAPAVFVGDLLMAPETELASRKTGAAGFAERIEPRPEK